MKKSIITASLLVGMLSQTKAQVLTLGINASQSGVKYKLANGTNSLMPSGGAELGLQVPLSNRLSLLTGLEAFRYRSKATLQNNTVYSHNQIDDMGSSFEYRIMSTGYSEEQSLNALRIPLMLQLTTGSPQRTQWYIAGGGKFMLPAKVKINASAQQLTTTGYYPDYHVEVKDLPQHGFGTINNWSSNSQYSLKAGYLLSGATGFSFKLSASGSTRLYAGVYVDYGVSDMRASDESHSLVSYQSQQVNNLQANGVMGMDGVSSMKMFNAGVQVKIGFGHKQKQKQTPVTTTTAIAAMPPPAPVILQAIEKKPEQSPKPKPTGKKLSAAIRSWIEQPVAFGKKNNVSLNTETKQHLDIVADMLVKYPTLRLIIKGHTCDMGTPTANEKRGKERATAVADYLGKQGVSKERMQMLAVGTTEPVVPNTSEENREQNRRVTITVIE